jgi:hypothetical protein
MARTRRFELTTFYFVVTQAAECCLDLGSKACPQTVLFEASEKPNWASAFLNDSAHSEIGDYGQAGFLSGLQDGRPMAQVKRESKSAKITFRHSRESHSVYGLRK